MAWLMAFPSAGLGFDGRRGVSPGMDLTDQFMQMGWGSRKVEGDGNATRYEMGEGGPGAIVDYIHEPNREAGSWTFGEGYVHPPPTAAPSSAGRGTRMTRRRLRRVGIDSASRCT